MTDPGSSPFLDNPRNLLDDDSQYNLKQVISNLQFQLSSVKTEKSLLEQNKTSTAQEYEAIITKKNEELSDLQQNVTYLYKQREQLQTKVENQTQIHEQQGAQLQREIDQLRHKNSVLNQRMEKLEFKYNNNVAKYDHIKSDLNYELQTNDQLNERIKSLKEENQKLAQVNNDLSENLKLAATQMSNDKSHLLQQQNDMLRKTNSQLQLKVDELLQNKTSVELLKQQSISLNNKITRLERYEQEALNLSIENSGLKAKFDDYFRTISASVNDEGDSNETTVTKFIHKFKDLSNNNVVLFDKFSQSESSLAQAESQIQGLKSQLAKVSDTVSQLQEQNTVKDSTIKELEHQKVLNAKEIEFLRNSLKKFDQLSKRENPPPADATSQYLSNLEKLVDQYKKEIEDLQREKTQPLLGNKRPRIIDEAIQPKEDINQRKSLQLENIELSTKIKTLSEEIVGLKAKSASLEEVKNKRESFHIVQYRNNPFNKDQLVKQKTLDLLREENQALINTYIEKLENIDQVPRAVFARQEQDKEILQAKIDQLAKKVNRIKSIYADKSKDILSIISRYFGYSIEFVPSSVNPDNLSSRIKLLSRYLSGKETFNGYLILDLNTKTLKANGNMEFKSLCEELVAKWVNEKAQIPCFLSALNLKIFETVLSN